MGSRSQRAGETAVGVVLGGLFLWGAWSLVPLVVGTVAAVILVAVFAADGVFSLPGWALGVGLGGLIFAGGAAWLLCDPEAKERMLWSLKFGGKFAALLLVTGSLLRVFESKAGAELVHPPGSLLGGMEQSLTQAVSDLSVAALWGAVLVIPVVLVVVAARIVQQAGLHR
jgi:hypothetical protein